MNLKRTSLCASIALMFAVIALPSHAQTAADFAEMRAEIKKLREELNSLKKTKAESSNEALAERVDGLELRTKDAVVAGDIGGSFRLPGSETSMRLYGFAELNMVKEFKGDNSDQDYSTFLPYAPLKNSAEANRNGRAYLTGRTSRIGIEASTPSAFGPIGVKVEGDFNNEPRTGNAAVSGSIGNIYTQQATNSYNFRLRHAYGQFGGLLIGQTWSTFMDVDNFPETVDFNGPIGQTFIRQPQIRYAYATKDSGTFTAAVENSASYVLENLGDGSAGITTKGFSRSPDFIGRWDKSYGWGAISLRGVLHELRIDNGAGISESSWGYGLAASGTYKVMGDDFMTWGLTGGTGIGRYLNYIEGAIYDPNPLRPRILKEKALGAYVSYQHKTSATLRFNGMVGMTHNYDNDYTRYVVANGFDSGRFGINRSVWQTHLGFIWNPVKGVDIGTEWIFGRRKTMAGEQGDMNRLNFSAKYYFN